MSVRRSRHPSETRTRGFGQGMGGRGGVYGFRRLSGMASVVMRDIADTLASLGSLFCELWCMIAYVTPQIVLNAVILRSSVQEFHLLSLIGSDQRELS